LQQFRKLGKGSGVQVELRVSRDVSLRVWTCFQRAADKGGAEAPRLGAQQIGLVAEQGIFLDEEGRLYPTFQAIHGDALIRRIHEIPKLKLKMKPARTSG
jgi:hypothetical protein